MLEIFPETLKVANMSIEEAKVKYAANTFVAEDDCVVYA